MLIYNIISISVIGFNLYGILVGLINKNYELYYCMNFSLFLERCIKHLTTDMNIFKRPEGACGCGLFNEGGIISHKSGFPSGHMTMTSVFMNKLLQMHNRENDVKYIILYNVPCVLMGISRYAKLCHSIDQIMAGYLLGYIISRYIKGERKITEYVSVETSYGTTENVIKTNEMTPLK